HDLLPAVVGTFDKDVRSDGLDKRQRRGLRKDREIIDRLQGGNNEAAIALGIYGSSGPFEGSPTRIAIEADDHHVAPTAALLKVLDVAGVQDVEASIGENDPLTQSPAACQFLSECLAWEDFLSAAWSSSEQVAKDLIARHGRDANLFNFQAAGNVGQANRRVVVSSRSKCHGQNAHDHIAGPGDVIDLARSRGEKLTPAVAGH